MTLRIDLPESYSAEEVVREIQLRLRASYPRATITVVDAGDGEPATWHVRRDGGLFTQGGDAIS